MDGVAKELKQHPDIDRANELLTQLANTHWGSLRQPGAAALNLYSALINETVPAIFDHLDETLVCKVFGTVSGLSSILGRIQALVENVDVDGRAAEYTKNVAVYSHMNLLGYLLSRVLEESTISTVWGGVELNAHHYRELVALYGGSRILSRASSARFLLDQVAVQMDEREATRYEHWAWLADEYVRFISGQVVQVGDSGLLEKVWKLGYPKVLCNELIQPDPLDKFVEMYKNLRHSAKQRVRGDLVKYFESQVSNDETTAPEKIAAIAAVLAKFDSNDVLDLSIRSNMSMRRVAALLCASASTLTHVFKQWGDPLGVKHNPLYIQEAQTQLVFFLTAQLSEQQIHAASTTPEYLNAISNRLAASHDRGRVFGTLVAELISQRAPGNMKPLDFSLGVLVDEQDYWKNVVARISDKPTAFNAQVWQKLDAAPQRRREPKRTRSPAAPGMEAPKGRRIQELEGSDDDDELKPYPMPENDPVDSDDEVEDGPTPKKERVRDPAYIKDLLNYLTSDDYHKHELALGAAASLIRRKARFGKELEFNAKALADVLAGLTDKYDLDKFDENKLAALSALVAGAAKVVAPHLSGMLFTGDYSMQQRMVILSSLTMGARELSGLEPQEELFASKYLPQELDNQFRTVAVEEVQRSLLKPTASHVEDELSGPQVLRVSKKLQKERQEQQQQQEGQGSKNTFNIYAKLAARYFILPLTTQWHQHGPVSGNVYTELVQAHLFKTLALQLHAAYPTCNDIPDLTGELLHIVVSQRGELDANVLEGLLTIVLVVLEVNGDGEYLATKYGRQVVEIKMWLEDCWHNVIDQRVRGMAAGVAYQLGELTETWQRRLVTQFAGLEATANTNEYGQLNGIRLR